MKKAFTLMEILIVVAIIGILATIVVASVASAQSKARDSKRKADLQTIDSALQIYFYEKKTYVLTYKDPATGTETCCGHMINNGAGPCSATQNTSAGYFNQDNNDAHYVHSIASAMISWGVLSQTPIDPTGATAKDNGSYFYMYYTNGAKYSIYARLESIVDSNNDKWDDSSSPGASTDYGPNTSYLVNYRIGNGG